MKESTNKLFMTLAITGMTPVLISSCVKESKTPNVIFILTDDLGYAELGCYGNTFNETPNIDALAEKGIRFTNAYAAQTVSSPTRAALMTGLYPPRTGIIDYLRPNDTKHLDEAYTTIAEVFKSKGYHTGMIGKWHQTGYTRAGAPYESSPDKHGFDEVIVSENEGIANGTWFHPYHFNKDIEKLLEGDKEFLVDRMNEEAVRFIDRQNKKTPFFLYLSHYAVHTHVQGKPEDVDHFRSKPGAGTSAPSKNNPENDPYKKWPADYWANKNNPHLAAQLRDIDTGVGAIVAKLKEKGLLDNTLIVFTSDNGGENNVTSNAPLRDGKSSQYEGGLRIAKIVYFPAKIPQGKVIEEQVVTYDYLPTFCEMLGVSKKTLYQQPDGLSLWSLWTGKKSALAERALYWHYPLEKPHFLGGRSSAVIRSGDWKLMQFYDSGALELYNLKDDIGESNNLVLQHPDIAKELMEKLNAWRADVGAVVPELP
jgi:arylsulfatase A